MEADEFMTKIIFVRHGESEANVKKIVSDDLNRFGLTAKGRHQVIDAAESLRGIEVDAMFSSPLKRTLQTADIVAKTIGYTSKIVVDRRLREVDYGKLNDRAKADGTWMLQALDPKNNAETMDSVYSRTMDFIKSMKKYDIAIAVTHKEPIASLGLHKLKLDRITGRAINVERGSISIIELKRNSISILAYGMPHIPDYLKKKLFG